MGRLTDVNGAIINVPEGFNHTVECIAAFIDSMEENQMDRADMRLVLVDLFDDAKFYMNFLPKRRK